MNCQVEVWVRELLELRSEVDRWLSEEEALPSYDLTQGSLPD